jgi:hypothetical protein
LAVVVAVKPTDTFSYLFVQFLGNAVVFVTAKDKGRGYLEFFNAKFMLVFLVVLGPQALLGITFAISIFQ